MTDDNGNNDAGSPDDLVPNVSEDRPLDSLMPEIQGGGSGGDEAFHADAPTDVGAIHPRVLEVGLEEGTEWTLACWNDPGEAGMRTQFGQLVRATLLKEMSRLPEWEREEERAFVGMRLLSFDSLVREGRVVLEELGFAEEPYDPDQFSERMAAWRQEARAAEMEVPARPVSNWHLPVVDPASERPGLAGVEARMLDKLGSEAWGQTPGAMSRHAARELEAEFDIEIALGSEGLRTMASYLTTDAKSAIRWTAPVFFQAICDFVGVVLHGKYGIRVQWGVCEPDPRGVVPPPMFRQPGSGTDGTIPIGAHVLDWCVMPVAEGGDVPDLADRLEALAKSLE